MPLLEPVGGSWQNFLRGWWEMTCNQTLQPKKKLETTLCVFLLIDCSLCSSRSFYFYHCLFFRTSTILPEHNSRTNLLCRFTKRTVSRYFWMFGAQQTHSCTGPSVQGFLFVLQAGTHHPKRTDKELPPLCTENMSLGQSILFSLEYPPPLRLNWGRIIFLAENHLAGSSDKYFFAPLQEKRLYSGITRLLPSVSQGGRWCEGVTSPVF